MVEGGGWGLCRHFDNVLLGGQTLLFLKYRRK